MKHIWFGLLALALLTFSAGCDYPQAGYYAIVGLDRDGKELARHSFGVEELVDDTEMTTGYVLLLPGKTEAGAPVLFEAGVSNGQDFTRRSWSAALSAADTGVCDLHVDLMHADETLSFIGACRRDTFSPVARLAASLFPTGAADANRLEFTGTPPQLPGTEDVAEWRIITLSQQQFEQALGGPLAKAKRIPATAPEASFIEAALLAEQVPLEQAAGTAQQDSSAAVKPGAAKPKLKLREKKKVPPLGGRNGGRPR